MSSYVLRLPMRDGNHSPRPGNGVRNGRVLRLPMRDGNLHRHLWSPVGVVLRLPMRDGNISNMQLGVRCTLAVLRLPMRDGNTQTTISLEHVKPFLDYL